jgi:hypothetical protein
MNASLLRSLAHSPTLAPPPPPPPPPLLHPVAEEEEEEPPPPPLLHPVARGELTGAKVFREVLRATYMRTAARNVGNFNLAAYFLFCERDREEREMRGREERGGGEGVYERERESARG